MQQKVLRFNPSTTRKSDFNTLFSAAISIAEKYDPEALHFNETLKRLEELIVPDLKHPLTKKLQAVRKKRSDYVSSIIMQAKARLKSDEPESVAASEALLPVAERILAGFSGKSFNTQFALAKQFIAEVEADEVLVQALSKIGLDVVFGKLKEVQQTVDETHNVRRKAVSGRKRMQTEKNKRTLYRLLSQLFAAIEAAQLEYPELDYTPLINELNEEIFRQRTANSIRLSRLKTDNQNSTEFLDKEAV